MVQPLLADDSHELPKGDEVGLLQPRLLQGRVLILVVLLAGIKDVKALANYFFSQWITFLKHLREINIAFLAMNGTRLPHISTLPWAA